jgi:hypothetical protein
MCSCNVVRDYKLVVKLIGERMAKADKKPKRRRKQDRDKAALHPVLAHFGSGAEAVELSDDVSLKETELAGSDAVDILLFRTEPREYSGPPHQYLDTFDTAPTLKLLRDRFGGGKYLIRVYKDGRFQKGAATVVIAGPPRVAPVEKIEKEPVAGAVTNGGQVSDVVLAMVERMRGEILEAVHMIDGFGKSKSTGLDASSLSDLIDVANRKMVETRILSGLLPAAQPTVAPESSNISDFLKLGLEIFKAGAEFGPKEADGSSGMLGMLQPLLQRLLTPAPAEKPGPVMPIAAHDPLAGVGVEPVDVEAQRREVEAQSAEARKAAVIAKLKNAVRLMLTAIESEVEYTEGEICEKIRQVISQPEIDALGDGLSFENVYGLMRDEPEEQIMLDEHKDSVTRILALLKGQAGGAGV